MKFSGFFILLLFVLTLTASAQAETVARVGTTNYETLQAALDDVNEGLTITVIKDVNEPNAECKKAVAVLIQRTSL